MRKYWFLESQVSQCIPLLRLIGVPVLFYCHHPDCLLVQKKSALRDFYRFVPEMLKILLCRRNSPLNSAVRWGWEICSSSFSPSKVLATLIPVTSFGHSVKKNLYIKLNYYYNET